MAIRSTTESSRHGFTIAEDSESENENLSSFAPTLNIIQYKKAIQYVDQVQFDSIQEIIKQLVSAVSRITNNSTSTSFYTLPDLNYYQVYCNRRLPALLRPSRRSWRRLETFVQRTIRAQQGMC